MSRKSSLFTASVIAFCLGATGVIAQTNPLVSTDFENRIDAVEDSVENDFMRAQERNAFGHEHFAPGLTSDIALTYAGKSGNTDTQDFAVAGRVRHNSGAWSQTVGFGLEYGEANSINTKKNIFAIYDANYYLADDLYSFALARAERDDFPGSKEAFIGVGPGYRLVNTDVAALRVQAGPGLRYQKLQNVNSVTEEALVASLRGSYRLTETIYATNDTDLLASEAGFLATNDLGLNLQMMDGLATRFSLRSEYNDSPVSGAEKTDNTLGASLVLSF